MSEAAAMEKEENKESTKEGQNLLGSPTFKKLENGRFKCVETGHELPAHGKDAYSRSKHCRLGLIDAALARNKPPLNMFRQDPLSSSKLVCKLTDFTINKSEEHIWKHINGKRFLHMLENLEAEKDVPEEEMEVVKDDWEKEGKKKKAKDKLKKKDVPEEEMEVVKDDWVKEGKKKKAKDKLKKKKKVKQDKPVAEVISEVRDVAEEDSDAEEEDGFWMPPAGARWDDDDGGDRWGSGEESGAESDEADKEEMEEAEEESGKEAKEEAEKLSTRTKRMSLEIGPSSFASRKKKKKTAPSS